MPTIYDVPVNDLIEEVAKSLHEFKEIQPPEWSAYAKTGVHKERSPTRDDWWHIRCAAVLRSVRNLQCVGVEKLRTKYGGRKRRGHKTEHFYKGSGNVIRKVLQQLEAAGLVKHGEKGNHKGRIITPKGVSVLDKAAVVLYKKQGASDSQKGANKETPAAKEKTIDKKVPAQQQSTNVSAQAAPVEAKPVEKTAAAKPAE